MKKTEIISVCHTPMTAEESEGIARAGALIRAGGLVVFPTETVYGLGADAFCEEAARRIYEAKGRPQDNPLIVHVADAAAFAQISSFASSRQEALAHALASRFWPGPLTMVLPKARSLPLATTGGLDTVALRCPAHDAALALIRASGTCIAAPSANLSGRPSPTSAAHCVADLDGRVDLIIDAGETRIGLESTIVDLTGEEIRILRPGMITKEAIGQVLAAHDAAFFRETAETDTPAESAVALAPGMKYRHYAPRAQMTIVRGRPEAVIRHINEACALHRAAGKRTGVIASRERTACYEADKVWCAGAEGDADAIAHNLYRILREADEADTDVLYSEGFTVADSAAVFNRLYKAAGGCVTEAKEG